jgi:hypothetical protein
MIRFEQFAHDADTKHEDTYYHKHSYSGLSPYIIQTRNLLRGRLHNPNL